MDFTEFLEGGYDDATFVPDVPEGEEIPVVSVHDFTAEVTVREKKSKSPKKKESVDMEATVPKAKGLLKRKKEYSKKVSDEGEGSRPSKGKKSKVAPGIVLREPSGDRVRLMPGVDMSADFVPGKDAKAGTSLRKPAERLDYVTSVVALRQMEKLAEMDSELFQDYANDAAIRQLHVQAEYVRRCGILDKHSGEILRENTILKRQLRKFDDEAIEAKYAELRADVKFQKEKMEATERELSELRAKFVALELEKKESDDKREEARDKVEKLMLEIVGFQDKEKGMQSEIESFKKDAERARDDKAALLAALPELIRKLHGSYEFAMVMASVQRKAVALGVHQGLVSLKKEMVDLDVENLTGYNLKAMAELQEAGKVFVTKDYDFIAKLAASSDLSTVDLLAIQHAPFPKRTTTSATSYAPSASAALTS